MRFNVVYYFSFLLLPLVYILVTRSLTVGEAILGCFLSATIICYKILENSKSTKEVQEYKETLKVEQLKTIQEIKQKNETEMALEKAHLKLEYETRISKLEEMLNRSNLEKIKRF